MLAQAAMVCAPVAGYLVQLWYRKSLAVVTPIRYPPLPCCAPTVWRVYDDWGMRAFLSVVHEQDHGIPAQLIFPIVLETDSVAVLPTCHSDRKQFWKFDPESRNDCNETNHSSLNDPNEDLHVRADNGMVTTVCAVLTHEEESTEKGFIADVEDHRGVGTWEGGAIESAGGHCACSLFWIVEPERLLQPRWW